MSIALTSEATPAKLPLGATIALAYTSFVKRIVDLLRISWVWLLIAVLPLWQWFGLPDVQELATTARSPDQASALWRITMAFLAVSLLGSASIAVAWHRLLMLDRMLPFSAGNFASGRLWRYILTGLLITLVVCVPAGVAVTLVFMIAIKIAPSLFSSDPVSTATVCASVLVICGLALLAGARLSLALPGLATDQRPRSIASAGRFGRGSSWRLFAGLTVCLVPWALGQAAPLLLQGLPDALNEGIVGTIVNDLFAVYAILTLQIPIAFLSHAHRFIAGRA
ncbi:hypothetical protein [Bradyrhizobium sp. 2TAF24]|uniref:hypothetical protein n=1 Tax=Bradyrhizobium sp. 2TAF24 TaxID=3233011 RepID=UPI003F8E6883